MEHSRQTALELVGAYHACCMLERDVILVISSLNYYKSSACNLLGEDELDYADFCGKMLSELYRKVSSAALSMTTRCADAIMEGKKNEGK